MTKRSGQFCSKDLFWNRVFRIWLAIKKLRLSQKVTKVLFRREPLLCDIVLSFLLSLIWYDQKIPAILYHHIIMVFKRFNSHFYGVLWMEMYWIDGSFGRKRNRTLDWFGRTYFLFYNFFSNSKIWVKKKAWILGISFYLIRRDYWVHYSFI